MDGETATTEQLLRELERLRVRVALLEEAVGSSPATDGGVLPSLVGAAGDVPAAVVIQERLAFLAGVSALLAHSLDYDITLANVARLAVPVIADWCTIDVVEPDGAIRRVAASHADPNRAETIEALRTWPPDPAGQHPLVQVLKTGKAVLYPEVPMSLVQTGARDAEHLAIVRALGVRSCIVAPLCVRARIFGALMLVIGDSGRRYGPADLALAEEVALRAAVAIDNARLYEEARQAVRLREEFLSIASHELRTPLTTIKGTAQFLARVLAAPDWERARILRLVGQLGGQIGRLEELIYDLLDASRIQQGRLEMRCDWLDLSGLARQTVERFIETGEVSAGHQLVLEAPAPVYVIGDGVRLDQVLTNLISNALKYSPAGGEVRVVVRAVDDLAELAVRDRGLGIPAEEQAGLFRPFIRSRTVGQRIKGVGLGLYIAAQIAERHGGAIGLDSTFGVGSTFTLRLPLAGPREPAARDERGGRT